MVVDDDHVIDRTTGRQQRPHREDRLVGRVVVEDNRGDALGRVAGGLSNLRGVEPAALVNVVLDRTNRGDAVTKQGEESRFRYETGHRASQVFDVTRTEEQSVHLIADDLGDATNSGGDNRDPGQKRLVDDERAVLGPDWSILIPVAVALLGLLAFSAFTIDNGVMLSSRRQAQNAADSAALAAALYLAWDDPVGFSGAQATAVAAAQQHGVWGNQPDVTLADVTFPSCPPGAPGLADVCVRVDVFRNQRAGGDPLPAFFAMLAGVTEQGVQATATAQVLYSVGVNDCMLPFAIPDRWLEFREAWDVDPPDPLLGDAEDDDSEGLPGPAPYPAIDYPLDSLDMAGIGEMFTDWDPDDTFDVVEQQGQQGGDELDPATGIDRYEEGSWGPLTTLTSGPTGYSGALDHGLQVTIKDAQGGQIAPSFYYPIILPDGLGSGMSRVRTRIQTCTGPYEDGNGDPIHVGPGGITEFTVEPGNMGNPIATEIQALVDLDPGGWVDDMANPSGTVMYDGSPMPIYGSYTSACEDAGNCTGGRSAYESPRHRAIATFDADNFMRGHRTGRGEVVITGVVGVYIEQPIGQDIVARITNWSPDPSSGGLTDDRSSFLRSVILVR